jgi:hypothetical protein
MQAAELGQKPVLEPASSPNSAILGSLTLQTLQERIAEIRQERIADHDMKVAQSPIQLKQEVVVAFPERHKGEILKEVPMPLPVCKMRKVPIQKAPRTVEDGLKEIPRPEVVEVIKKVPIEEGNVFAKEVTTQEVQVQDIWDFEMETPQISAPAYEEVDCVIVEERQIEVPDAEVKEVVKEIPRPVVNYIDRQVPKYIKNFYQNSEAVLRPLKPERIIDVSRVVVVDSDVIKQAPE